jgi:hypothetical protein
MYNLESESLRVKYVQELRSDSTYTSLARTGKEMNSALHLIPKPYTNNKSLSA